MQTVKYPCSNCRRVPKPNNCENKSCKVWREWFLKKWTEINACVNHSDVCSSNTASICCPWISVKERLPIAEYEAYKQVYRGDPEYVVLIENAVEASVLWFGKDSDDNYVWYDEEAIYPVSHWLKTFPPKRSE